MKIAITALITAAALATPVWASGATPVVAPVATAPAATPILPGYWEYTARLYGIPQTKRKCLKPDEVEDFLTRPCNRHYTCVYPTKQVSAGKLLLDGYWQAKNGDRAKVHATGVFEPRSFTIKANGSAIGGVPFLASMGRPLDFGRLPGGYVK